MFVLLLCALLASQAGPTAVPRRVSLIYDPRGVNVAELTIVLTRIESDAPPPSHQVPLRGVLRRDEPLSFELETGNWQLDVQNIDVWHATQYFAVEPSSTKDVAVTVWPRAILAGAVVHDSKIDPSEMIVRFEPSSDDQRPTAVAGEVRCPIQDARFLCAMPAGTYTLRMRPKGFIAHYFPATTLTPGKALDLGSLRFQQGQSITGHVQLPPRFAAERTAIRVTASPVGATAAGLLSLRALPEKNGFFHIDGVAPGAYVVSAALERTLTSPSVEVLVRAASEAELMDPLRLNWPRKIQILILPAASFDGAPWHVKLYRASSRHLEEITESRALADGIWESPPLQPGMYEIAVGTTSGSEWHREEILLETQDYRTSIVLARSDVSGMVALGTRPLQASLTFSGRSGFAVTAHSDERGHFTVALPKARDAEINVRVHSDVPWIQRTVHLKVPPGKESVDLALPDSVVMGEVVDGKGAPAAGALVSFASEDLRDGLLQPASDKDGKFEVHGLSPGTYRVIATDFLKESEPSTVRVTNDEPPDPLHLILQDMEQLRGRVVSPGGPVPGARVQARATNVPHMIVHNRQTDANGVFAAALPAGAQAFEMTVASPGFSFVIAGGALSENALTVQVDQNGGTLVIEADKRDTTYLVHNGGTCVSAAVSYQWPSQQNALPKDAQELVLPMMEPGPYAACLVAGDQYQAFRRAGGQTGGRCVSGFLPPFGSLTLDLRGR